MVLVEDGVDSFLLCNLNSWFKLKLHIELQLLIRFRELIRVHRKWIDTCLLLDSLKHRLSSHLPLYHILILTTARKGQRVLSVGVYLKEPL